MTVERYPITTRNEWLQWRQGFLGASEVPAAAGLDEYRSPLSLYAEKTGLTSGVAETPAMRRGRLLEGAAIEYLQEEHPDWRIVRPNIFVFEPELGLSCTPDALVELPDAPDELINCQIKIVSRPRFEDWNGRPPIGYQIQTTCENMLLGAARGILCVLVLTAYDAELHLFDVPRHAEAELRIREIAREFWDNIAAGRRPAADYARDAETIAAMFPPDKAVPVPLDLTGDNRLPTLLEQREKAKATERAAVAESKAIERRDHREAEWSRAGAG